MKWKRLRYVMKNRKSKSLRKRVTAEIYKILLQQACRREALRLSGKYPHMAPPKYSARDILGSAKAGAHPVRVNG